MLTCPNGHENPEGTQFCGTCGQTLTSASTMAGSTPSPPPGGSSIPPPPTGAAPPTAPPPGAYQTPPPGYYQQQTSSKAVISLVLGIVSLVMCGLFAGIPALILGYSARKEIRQSGGREGGEGMATAGIVTGWIGTVLSTLAIVFVFAVFLLGEPAEDEFVPVDDQIENDGGINSDPADGVCDMDRFLQDPDC